MVGLRRWVRDGLVLSALGHASILAVSLIFALGGSQHAVLPDAMPVELVELKEIPRFSGTPSELRTSGSETAGKPQSAVSEPPQPVPPPPPKKQTKAQRKTASKPQEQQPTPAQEPPPQEPPPQTEAGKLPAPKPPPDPPAPTAEKTPDEPETAARMAQLALLGGRLGGGFAAPPIDSPLVGYDFTLAFRERVSACTAQPPGVDPSENIRIRARVFLNRDGTLASEPQLLEPNPSAKQQAVMQAFTSGLQQCQPYTMLPPDKYKSWKTLDLMVYPLNAAGG